MIILNSHTLKNTPTVNLHTVVELFLYVNQYSFVNLNTKFAAVMQFENILNVLSAIKPPTRRELDNLAVDRNTRPYHLMPFVRLG